VTQPIAGQRQNNPNSAAFSKQQRTVNRKNQIATGNLSIEKEQLLTPAGDASMMTHKKPAGMRGMFQEPAVINTEIR